MNCFAVDNKNELLPVVSGFIIGRPCLWADPIVYMDIVVHRLGMIGHVHMNICIGGKEAIGLKYIKDISYQTMD